MKKSRTKNHGLLLAAMTVYNHDKIAKAKAAAEVMLEAIDGGASYEEVQEMAARADEVLADA